MSEDREAAFADCWPPWCSLASRLLNWRPAEFWSATPAELIAALRDPETNSLGAAAPSRDLISQLMERDQNG